MLSDSSIAFKEWAVICAALDQGRQSLILRKGGIHEGRDGFRVQHREFWLYPTEFHQQPDVLAPEAESLLSEVRFQAPAAGTLVIRNFVSVAEVIEIRDAAILSHLAGLHLWSSATVAGRFQYRTPGLFALLVRVYRRTTPLIIDEQAEFGGCRSWVDLRQMLPADNLTAVLSDHDHEQRLTNIRAALGPRRT